MLCLTLLAAYAKCVPSYTGQTAISDVAVPTVNATLYGAADASYALSIPVDMSLIYTNELLSISKIAIDGGKCTFCGVDGVDVTTFVGPGTFELTTVDVGPPQTIVGVACS